MSADPGDQLPEVISQERPWYPPSMYHSKMPGEVVVDFYVDINGDVRNASVVKWTRPEFIPPALEAVNQWKFKPGRRHDHAVNTHLQVPILFGLDDHQNYSKITDPEHLYRIGAWFQEDKAGKPDFAKAVDCFRRAAAQNYPKAEYALGMLYGSGRGIAKDTVEGLRLIRKAADQGYPQAQCAVGMAYAIGEGVPKDESAAVEWYRKSARQDYALAQYLLAICLKTGVGVPVNFDEAATQLKLAAHQHLVAAEALLGEWYAVGEVMPKDPVQAFAWLEMASTRGSSAAQARFLIVERELSPKERTEGRRLSTLFSTETGVTR